MCGEKGGPMNNDLDNEAGEMVDNEAAGESDFKLEEQTASPLRQETNYPHLFLIKSEGRAVKQSPDHNPPGWPDF